MTAQKTTMSSNPTWKQIVVAGLIVAYVVISVFRIGGDKFVFALNTNMLYPLALAVTTLATILWHRVAVGSRNRLIWSGLVMGWALWTIAEIWWAVIATLSQEAPDSSVADIFWLAGYVPMYIALWERIGSLPQNVKLIQKAGIWLVSLIVVGGTTVLTIMPILQDSVPSTFLEGAVNIIYPLADLALLIPVIRIFFAYQQGAYGRSWKWLSAGFVLMTLSDLVYAYAVTAGLYYPNGEINFFTSVSDIPYNLSYICWIIGLSVVETIHSSHYVLADENFTLTLGPDTHILVFIHGNDTVSRVSRNHMRVFGRETTSGEPVSETLGISTSDAAGFMQTIKAERILKEQPVLVHTRAEDRQAGISGVAVATPQGEYTGAILLLRMLTGNRSFDALLTDYDKGILRSLLRTTGTETIEETEIKRVLSGYYRAYLQALYNRVFAEGGSLMTDAFIAELQSVAKQHKAVVKIRPDALLDIEPLPLSTAREICPILLNAARDFVAALTDQTTADTIVHSVRARFDDVILESVERLQ